MKARLRAILTDEVDEIFAEFTECLGIRISFFDAEGSLIKHSTDETDCRYCNYCQLIRELYGPERCEADDASALERSLTQGMHSYTCHAGLVESVVPLYAHGCLLGYAMIGQIRAQEEIPAHVAEDARAASRFPVLRKAFFELELTRQRRLDSILGLFSVVAQYIVTNHLVSMNVSALVANAVNYMREHVHTQLTTQELADQLATSPSTLSHAFARELGTSFKQMFTEMKLARADEMMMEEPDISVARVAERVGFDDPSHFSRMYKNRRGYPPSAFQDNLKKTGRAAIAVAPGVLAPELDARDNGPEAAREVPGRDGNAAQPPGDQSRRKRA